MFNDTLGNKYRTLIKYSNPKTLLKRIQNDPDSKKNSDFIKQLKQDYIYFDQKKDINES